jgi:hypothetical protein
MEKKITNKTILKKEDKKYQPIEFGDMITWCDEYEGTLAQSQPKLEGIPVISLDSYVEKQIKDWYNTSKLNSSFIADPSSYKLGYKANPNQYTKADIEKAFKLGEDSKEDEINGDGALEISEVIEIINSISVIEVNEEWEVISYE